MEGKNAIEQGKNLNLLVKNKRPSHLAWETSNFFKIKYANTDLLELIYFNGIIPYISAINHIENSQKILNLEVVRHLNSGDITGLELRLVKGEKGRPKQVWFFRNQEVTIHQRDALAVFFVYWTVKLKKPWPWI